ncbi:dipeptidyl peptidase 9-like [Dysidea avara]|uniref:dipeptidyl peptidase 9-like n=1 Tax=Dysidea avara TaxID=196820 RepID=UPI00331DCBE5
MDTIAVWSKGHIEVEDQVTGLLHEDQVTGLLHVTQQEQCVDLSRVAVHSWSYGGYMSIMCLAQRADFFKVAIAGAPVTMWEDYDTGYTERYLSRPTNIPVGYRESSVLAHAQKLPGG